jgi:SAM-dependent methyltransferase
MIFRTESTLLLESGTALGASAGAAQFWRTVHGTERLGLHAALYTWPAAQIAPGWVLDLGSEYGFGSLLITELNQVLRIASMDLDAAGLRYSQATSGNGRMAQVQADARRLPVAPECFTGIYLIHVLHLVQGLDRVLSEVRRALKPGGLAVVSLPYFESDNVDEQVDHQSGSIKAALGEFFSEVDCPAEIRGQLPSLPSQVFRLDAQAAAWLALCRK